MSSIKAVLFDMDGLMYNTEPVYQKAWTEAAIELGINLTRDFFIQVQGRTTKDSEAILKKTFDQNIDIDLFREKWLNKWQEIARGEGIEEKKGLRRLLDWLRQMEIQLALATSSNKIIMDLCLDLTGLGNLFQVTVCGQHVEKGKPEPDIYQKAANLLNVPAVNCMVLEDSLAGAYAGLNAGMKVLMIPDQVQPPGELQKKVTGVLADLDQVRNYLRQYINDPS